jgi:hypothetical protein
VKRVLLKSERRTFLQGLIVFSCGPDGDALRTTASRRGRRKRRREGGGGGGRMMVGLAFLHTQQEVVFKETLHT